MQLITLDLNEMNVIMWHTAVGRSEFTAHRGSIRCSPIIVGLSAIGNARCEVQLLGLWPTNDIGTVLSEHRDSGTSDLMSWESQTGRWTCRYFFDCCKAM